MDGDHLGGVDAHANEPEEETRGVAGEQQEVKEVAAEHRCGEAAKGVLGGDRAANLGVVRAVVTSRWQEGDAPTMRQQCSRFQSRPLRTGDLLFVERN